MLSLDVFISKIGPASEQFLKSSTKSNLETLQHELQEVDDSTLDRLQCIILVPLVIKLDEIDDAEMKVQLINILEQIISRITLKEQIALKTILVVTLKQIYNFQSDHVNSTLSEEFKLAGIRCIATTTKSCSADVIEHFYSKENAALLGKILVTCIDFISKEKYRLLRICAIECLMSIFYVHDVADKSDIVLREKVAGTLFVFLPKIVQTLIAVANGDEKQGQQLTAIGIRALSRILCLIFEDYTRSQNEGDIQVKDFMELVKNSTNSKKSDDAILGSAVKSQVSEERFKTLLSMERNSAWLGASSRKLTPILKTMAKLRVHSSQIVRREYGAMCRNLFENCSKHLNENLSIFIETIFALSQDDDQELRGNCIDFLMKCNQSFELKSFLSDSVTNLIEIHLISLPRIINRWEDTEQLSEFLFLKGILENSSDDCLSTVLCVPNNLEKFCMCLISGLELELSNELLKEEYALRSFDAPTNCKILVWRKYKNINNERIVKLIESICENLGKTKISEVIFDHLMENFIKDSPVCNEILLILIMMLRTNSTEIKFEKIPAVFEEILHERRWSLEFQPNQMNRLAIKENSRWFVDRTPGLYESAIEIRTRDISLEDEDDEVDNSNVNINEAQFNVLHTCLVLDAVGHFAIILGNQFQPYMFKILHRVLQKAGSSNYVVHQAGMFALQSIQSALKLDTTSDLIRDNSDYISYHVNISLKKMDSSKAAFDILSIVLQNSSFNSIAYLENIITTILEESSRFVQISNVESFLKVFHMFLLNVAKWLDEINSKELNENPEEEEPKQIDIYDNWMKILNKPLNDDTIPEGPNVNIESEEQLQEQVDKESPPKENLPRHIEIIIKILKEVLKFVASKNQIHKIISLECLITGLPLLKDFENELLPIVHLIWQPFAQRFKENDVIVLNRCFSLLEVLARHAKDFLLQRTLNDIFPILNDFLYESSRRSEKDSCIIQTQEFKLQSKLLQQYPNLIENMEVEGREMDRISEAVLLYLNKSQPKALQQYAVDYFCRMASYNCPAIFIKLSGHTSDIRMERNIKIIFDYINSRK